VSPIFIRFAKRFNRVRKRGVALIRGELGIVSIGRGSGIRSGGKARKRNQEWGGKSMDSWRVSETETKPNSAKYLMNLLLKKGEKAASGWTSCRIEGHLI